MDGEAVLGLPYAHRLEVMKELPNQAHRQIGGDAIAFYHEAINAGFEGIIVKDADAEYQPENVQFLGLNISHPELI